MSELLRLENITCGYPGNPVLENLSMSLSVGEAAALCGSNGTGKTTLIKLLNGLLFPISGSYYFEGTPITREKLKDQRFAKSFHRRVGYVFQNAEVQLFCSSVRDEIAFGPLQLGISREEAERRTEDLLNLFDLKRLEDRPPYHLSGGEQKRTAFAAVLSVNPELLILDEPLAGLDKKTRRFLMDFLLQWKLAGKTLLFATHDEELVESLADRVIQLDEEE